MNSLTPLSYEIVEESVGIFSFISSTSNQEYTFNISFQIANENDGFADLPDIRKSLLIVAFRTIPIILNIRKIRDPRIANTIIHYFELALNNGFIINYLCSDLGGFERHRKLIFNRWFSNFERKEAFYKIDYDLINSKTGKITYLSFIIKRNNPLFNDFLRSIEAEIDLYKDNK